MMRQDTNPSFNYLALMALAGAAAAFGIVSDTIHVVVGAMLIAPGFEPMLRIVFGLLGERHSVTAGLRAAAFGYLALTVAAAAALPIALFLNGMSADQLATAPGRTTGPASGKRHRHVASRRHCRWRNHLLPHRRTAGMGPREPTRI